MQRNVVRLVSRHLVGRPQNLRLRLLHTRPRALHLRLQLRHVEYSQHLALLHPVANIYVDAAYVARNLGMKFDFLVGNKFSGNGERVCQCRA